VIVLPGGGYAQHAAHEAEPIARWLGELGVVASVFRYPLTVRHPVPLNTLRVEIRRLRDGGSTRIGVIGFSAGGHLAGLAALADGADPDEAVDSAWTALAASWVREQSNDRAGLSERRGHGKHARTNKD
jgi:acetyl esterase/lipase